MRQILARLANLFRPSLADREMTREIESHLRLLQDDFEHRGLPPTEARLAALRAYGGVEQARELHREARSIVWLEQFAKDLRYGSRNLLRSPGFTLVAVLALALGIGVNATMFGIYNAVALKQLPVADPSRVVRLTRWYQSDFSLDTFAYPEYQYLRDHTRAFSDVTAATAAIPVMASIPGTTAVEHLRGYAVSANYFAGLGVPARLGRTFLPEEDRASGANPVVVLQYRYWQSRFQANPNVIGRTIKLNGMAYAIIGVAPPGFTGTDTSPVESDFWAPLSMLAQLNPAIEANWREPASDTSRQLLQLLARLNPGVPRATAQAETDGLLRRFLSSYRQSRPTLAITLHRTAYFAATGNIVFQVFAAAVLMIVSLVLVVACANVANMLLARGAARQREIAVRLALGAGRARVIRQLLTESTLLSLVGGVAGVLLSAWAGRHLWTSLTGMVPALRDLRVDLDVAPDAHVLLYGLILSLVTGILCGLAPALQFTRLDLHSAVKEEGSAFGPALRPSRLRGVLLGAQVTVSVLLLIVSGQLGSSILNSFVTASGLGFETHDTYFVRAGWGRDRTKSNALIQRLRDRLETLPEVSRVATGWQPLQGTMSIGMTAGNSHGHVESSFASDEYFETLGIRMLYGRGFTRQEANRDAPVTVISESAARRLWPAYPSDSPLGKHLSLERTTRQFTDYEVIGIVRDVRFQNITRPDRMHVYLPAGAYPAFFGGLLLRIRTNRDKALAAVESAVDSVDPSLLRTLSIVNLEDGPVAVQRTLFRVLGVFALILTLLSLTLAAIGIYGVMAFLVSQRTREIGIRMALGATAREVIRDVILQGLRPVFIGLLLGTFVAAILVSRLRAIEGVADLFFQGKFADPAVVGELALVLAIAILACILPAGRALRVDPMVALRHD